MDPLPPTRPIHADTWFELPHARELRAEILNLYELYRRLPKIPPGGTTGQVLVKKSDSDYDTEWVTP